MLKMREMLFRGRPKKQSKYIFFSSVWQSFCKDGFVYGSLVIDKDRCFIAVSALCQQNSAINNGITSMIEVIPETIGQYTGLTDKKGKKIFDKDVVKLFLADGVEIGMIGWSDIDVRYKFASPDGTAYGVDCTCVFEIIGNIHDYPELRKGGV